MSRLIILDRDGVINEDSDEFIKSVDECQLIEGSADAIARLSDAGYVVVVATNQSGIARGLFDEFDLAQIHQHITTEVEEAGGHIEAFVYCPHGPDDNCDCRKPRPGLLEKIALELGLPLSGCPLVGDSLRDLQAAHSAGCEPVLVLSGKGEKTLAAGLPAELESIRIYKNLSAFVDAQLSVDDA